MSKPLAVLKESPFHGRVRVMPIDVAAVPTIAEIAAGMGDVPEGFLDHCEARINGDFIPRCHWHHARPRYTPDRDVVVSFTLPLGGPGGGGGGGGGGGKNTMAMVATIAVLLVAAAVSGGLAAGLLGTAFAAGTVGASVLGAGIAIGGSLAIAALAPPPSFGTGAAGLVGGAKTGFDTRQPASLNGNVLAKGAAIPRVLGTHRLFPPLLTQPLVEIVGKDQFVEAVFGLSGPHAISDLMIGATATATMPDITTEITEGLPTSSAITMVTRQSFTDTTLAGSLDKHDCSTDDGISLLDQVTPANSLPQWFAVASRTTPDEIWIPLVCPAGLMRTDNQPSFVPIRVRIRPSGTSTWINLPEFHINLYQQTQYFGTIKLMWQNDIARNTPDEIGGMTTAFYSVPTQSVAPIGLGGWTANSHFYSSGDTYLSFSNIGTTGLQNINCYSDRIEFYLSGATFPQSGAWEIQIMRGQAGYYPQFVPASYVYWAGNTHDLFGYYADFSDASLRLPDHQTDCADDISVARVSSIWNTTPIPDSTKFAAVALKAKNRSVQDFSVLASGYTYDWDGSGWNTLTTTSNPAPHFYDVLTGPLGGDPLPPEIIDSAGLVAWRTNCIAMGYNANVVVEGKTYADVLTILAAAGYARPSHNELWGVMYDRDRSGDSPVQIFTPRNMSEFAWKKAFTKLPSGIRARYNDSTDFYKPASDLLIYLDPEDQNADRLEQISYDAYVTAAEVTARAAFDLLQIQKRMTFYSGKTDFESIVCTRGDLVGVQHDILMEQAGFSRVKSVTRSAGNITGLELDGTVPVMTLDDLFATADIFVVDNIFDLGAQTGMVIRLKDGSGILTKTITAASNDDVTTIAFATPFADPGTDKIDEGCLVTVGRLGSEYKRLIVYGIVPDADGTAAMTFVDEAPELWS